MYNVVLGIIVIINLLSTIYITNTVVPYEVWWIKIICICILLIIYNIFYIVLSIILTRNITIHHIIFIILPVMIIFNIQLVVDLIIFKIPNKYSIKHILMFNNIYNEYDYDMLLRAILINRIGLEKTVYLTKEENKETLKRYINLNLKYYKILFY